MKQLILDAIQEQMEQAVECLNENQPNAAQVHYLECSKLCQQLEIERQLAKEPPAQKQLTINIS